MTSRRIAASALLVFVALSLGYLAFRGDRENRTPSPVADQASAAEARSESTSKKEDKALAPGELHVIAYYFHGDFRCRTCHMIEEYSAEAIKAGFPDELSSDKLEWRVVNIEDEGNEHFIDDYRLTNKSLVLVKMAGSRQVEWKNLQRVWELVRNKAAFLSYVREETRAYLGDGA